jgi:hypothetical protein
MSPRLRATLECKADALEMKEILSRVSANRRTNKRVKHWIEMRRESTRQETLLPVPAVVGTPFIVQQEAVRYQSIPKENNRIIGYRSHATRDNRTISIVYTSRQRSGGVLAMCLQ